MTIGRPFPKGVSGNPKGRSRKARLFDDALKEALSAKNGAQAKLLTAKLLELALAGNVQALKLVAERIGGKPRSAIEIEQQATEPAGTREQTRAKLVELLRSPELRELVEASLKPPESVQ